MASTFDENLDLTEPSLPRFRAEPGSVIGEVEFVDRYPSYLRDGRRRHARGGPVAQCLLR
ncbi:hypothetical protein OCAE111667_21770 [Occultella aeris]|uniref:Uncharacterized protein n=1 Tax=Occultella aeris TaxID=2761496 RepID=A0A7M4DS80_9MICO|nr:hypothetical protein [Occultella aeris]VZO40324.1 hypothetical protein HALOF300_05028 [Occultella aeris]